MCNKCEEYKKELKRIYRSSSRLSGKYKSLYDLASRFIVGLFDTKSYDDGIKDCEDIKNFLDKTNIYD